MGNPVSNQFVRLIKLISIMDLVETASHILDQILQELSVAQINAMIDKLFSWMEHVRIAHHLQEPQLANKLVGQISVTSVRY